MSTLGDETGMNAAAGAAHKKARAAAIFMVKLQEAKAQQRDKGTGNVWSIAAKVKRSKKRVA